MKMHPAKYSYSKLVIILVSSMFIACTNSKVDAGKSFNHLTSDSSLSEIDSVIRIPNTADSLVSIQTKSKDRKSDEFIGKIVISIDDLLDLIYPPGKPAIVEEIDTVEMSIAEIIGNDTLKIVYLNGESNRPNFGHIFYLQSVVFLRKTNYGWEIMDVNLNQTAIDYNMVEFVGVFGGKMLTRYLTHGDYAGGVTFSTIDYTWHEVNSLSGGGIYFITSRSNALSWQCIPEPDKTCQCYASEGKETFYYDSKLNCLVFDYIYENTTGECEMKNPETEIITQKWYVNNNIALLAKGNALSEHGDHILEKVNLSEKEIMEALKN